MAYAEVAGRRGTGRGIGTVFGTPFPGNVTSGNLLIVTGTIGRENSFGGGSPGSVAITVTDTRGTVYTVVRGLVIGVNIFQRQTFIAYGLAPSSGANTVTITLSNSCSIAYAIDEFSGNHASEPFHNSLGTLGSGTTPRAGAIFPSVSNAMLIGVMAHSAATTPLTPNVGVTEIGEWETNGGSADNNNSAFSAAFRVFSGTGSFSISWTTPFIPWGALAVAFKPPTPITPERTTVGKSASLLWKIQKTVGRSAQLLWSVEVVEWPDDIPVPLRAHRRAIDLQNLTTEMETGRLRKRRQQEDHREIWDVNWNFTDDQFETFKEFFDTTLKNGSIPFHIELFGRQRRVEFAGSYSFNHSDNLYTVTATWLVPALTIAPVETNLVAWLKAEDLELVDGTAVSSWADASRDLFNFAQATSGNRPTFKTNILNGYPVIRFDGINDLLAASNASIPQPYSIVIVARNNASSGIFTEGTGAEHVMTLHSVEGTLAMNAGSWVVGTGVSRFNEYKVFTSIFNGGLSKGYTNGTETTSGDTGSNGTGSFQIGRLLNGDIVEILIYNQALTLAERLQVESYLRSKYSI